MHSTSKLTRKYQATIPQQVREFLQLAPGDSIAFEFEHGQVVLKKAVGIDWEYLQAVSDTLTEWDTAADEEAYREL